MLCSKFKHFGITKSTLHNNVHFRCIITSRIILKKWVWVDELLTSVSKRENNIMSPLRMILKDFRVWSGWTRCGIVNTVVRRCRRDRGVREVIQCFRQTFFRPRRTLLISATAAYKARSDDDEDDNISSCQKSISDMELQELLKDLETVEKLSQSTLYCSCCGNRLVIDKKQPGVRYCSCKVAQLPESTEQTDGWVPYMEAEDVIIWRKEYKPGLGLYAYKVYGRYPEVCAADFAAVQMDGAYRRVWDAAVAALAVVERGANGLPDQAVLHWEVLWPRLFANRDYVFIRRHREFEVVNKGPSHSEKLFKPAAVPIEERSEPIYTERPSVHSNAKRKAMEAYAMERHGDDVLDNKVYVILSRSCEHPDVPQTKHAIRVSEYWSHMVVKTMNGGDKSGMEFVLTYYDEPAVGGMPSSVAAWASGRAAPAYLQRMRRAAIEYRAWRHVTQQEIPDFTPFIAETTDDKKKGTPVNEQDMESSQRGPELEHGAGGGGAAGGAGAAAAGGEAEGEGARRDQATQTELATARRTDPATHDKGVEADLPKLESAPTEGVLPKAVEEEEPKNGGWWRYLYPFYYFV